MGTSEDGLSFIDGKDILSNLVLYISVIKNNYNESFKKKLSAQAYTMQSADTAPKVMIIQCPPPILAPLFNMSKGGSNNKSALS